MKVASGKLENLLKIKNLMKWMKSGLLPMTINLVYRKEISTSGKSRNEIRKKDNNSNLNHKPKKKTPM